MFVRPKVQAMENVLVKEENKLVNVYIKIHLYVLLIIQVFVWRNVFANLWA